MSLVALGCRTTTGDADPDGVDDTSVDDTMDEELLADPGPDCGGEADVVLGDAPFTPTECFPDPAVAVIEVTLLTMEVGGWVHTAPAAEFLLTEQEMFEVLHQELIAHDCDHELIVWENGDVYEKGTFTWIVVPPTDLGAAGLFDGRTGELVFAHPSDWLSVEVRCTPPDPLNILDTGIAPAREPIACHSSADGCAGQIDRLNYWGNNTSCDSGCWIDRTYDEVWEMVKHTPVVNGFDACGDYELFVKGMTLPGSYCVQRDANKMIFVLAGYVDSSILE